MIKRRYLVKKNFTNNGKLYKVGEEIPHRELKDIPKDVIEESVHIQDFNDVNLAINHGLIFQSKEYPFPEGEPEETRTQMELRMLNEMLKNDNTCEDNE